MLRRTASADWLPLEENTKLSKNDNSSLAEMQGILSSTWRDAEFQDDMELNSGLS